MTHNEKLEIEAEVERLRAAVAAAQAFFENLAAECRKPHVGEAFREYTRALLVQAQGAGLYRL